MTYSTQSPKASATLGTLGTPWFRMAQAIHLEVLNKSQSLTHTTLQTLLDERFDGAWTWREGYDAAEGATRLFLRQWFKVMARKTSNLNDLIGMLERLQGLLPAQRFRSEEQNQLQQFSTPIALAYLACHAGHIKENMTVLEPSAGTGALAVFAELAGASLHLNEIGEHRLQLLEALFPEATITKHHAGYIHAKMQDASAVDVVLMNPPFSADPNKPLARSADETVKHFQSAFHRLKDGGRGVIITGEKMTVARLVASSRPIYPCIKHP